MRRRIDALERRTERRAVGLCPRCPGSLGAVLANRRTSPLDDPLVVPMRAILGLLVISFSLPALRRAALRRVRHKLAPSPPRPPGRSRPLARSWLRKRHRASPPFGRLFSSGERDGPSGGHQIEGERKHV